MSYGMTDAYQAVVRERDEARAALASVIRKYDFVTRFVPDVGDAIAAERHVLADEKPGGES